MINNEKMAATTQMGPNNRKNGRNETGRKGMERVRCQRGQTTKLCFVVCAPGEYFFSLFLTFNLRVHGAYTLAQKPPPLSSLPLPPPPDCLFLGRNMHYRGLNDGFRCLGP